MIKLLLFYCFFGIKTMLLANNGLVFSDSLPLKNNKIIPKFSIRYGTTPGNVHAPPFLRQIYGSRKVQFYNTPYFSPTRFAIDEPDNFLQIEFRKNDRFAYSLLLMKQKINAFENGFKLEAPTAIEFGFSTKKPIFSYKIVDISADFSASGGFTLADAKFINQPNLKVKKPKIMLGGYAPVGFGATAIARLDITFWRVFSIFFAGNLHHYQGIAVKTNVGNMTLNYLGSAEMTTGIGFNF